MVNVICQRRGVEPLPPGRPGVARAGRPRHARALPEGVINLVADRLETLPITRSAASRDFR